MVETRKIKVLDLLLWDENSRLPDKLSAQDQAVIRKALLDDEKLYGVREFTKEVFKDIDLPQMEKLVVISEGNKFVTYEGNRRVVAYQCLINPILAGKYEREFQELAMQAKIPEDFELECLVTEDFQQANRYLERKHLNNNNEKPWGQYERDNHNVRAKRNGGNADKNRIRRVNIGKLVDEVALPEAMKKKVLGRGYVSNFYRIVDSAPGYNNFGFNINGEGEVGFKNKDDSLAKLKIFIYELLTSKPPSGQSWSRAYNSNEEIEIYLKTLDPSVVSKVDEEIESSKAVDLFGEEEINLYSSKGKSLFTKAKLKEYPTLIPSSAKRLNLNNDSLKINDVYKELKHIIIKDCPTAVSVLIRVLIEITVKRFLIIHGEKFDRLGRLEVSGSKPREELKQKLNYIATTYAEGDIKNAIIALNENLLTQSLNQVTHNKGYFATEKQIRDFWKTLKGVFEFLIHGIIGKEKNLS